MSDKNTRNSSKKGNRMLLLIGILVIVLTVTLILTTGHETEREDTQPVTETGIQQEPGQIHAGEKEKRTYSLAEGLEITDVGSYTGSYVEDGSDEVVSGVMMIIVSNTSNRALEYAQITLSGESEEAFFTVSALPAGESAVLLEKNRKDYDSGAEYSQAKAENIAYFQTEPSLMEDMLKIQPLDGGVNVTNISDQDISGDIFICYKNKANGLFYGGIAYRVRIEGGLKAGEIRQIMTNHFSDSGTAIVFVTAAQ